MLGSIDNVCSHITSFNAPNLVSVGHGFMQCVGTIENFGAPKLKSAKSAFLRHANLINYDLHSLEKLGSNGLGLSKTEIIFLPSLKKAGAYFLETASNAKKIYLPSIKRLEDNSLKNVSQLEELYIPNLEYVGTGFLSDIDSLEKLDAPKLKVLPDSSLWFASNLKRIDAPSLRNVGNHVVYLNNSQLEYLNIPSVMCIGEQSFGNIDNLQYLRINKGTKIAQGAFGLSDNEQEYLILKTLGLINETRNIKKTLTILNERLKRDNSTDNLPSTSLARRIRIRNSIKSDI